MPLTVVPLASPSIRSPFSSGYYVTFSPPMAPAGLSDPGMFPGSFSFLVDPVVRPPCRPDRLRRETETKKNRRGKSQSQSRPASPTQSPAGPVTSTVPAGDKNGPKLSFDSARSARSIATSDSARVQSPNVSPDTGLATTAATEASTSTPSATPSLKAASSIADLPEPDVVLVTDLSRCDEETLCQLSPHITSIILAPKRVAKKIRSWRHFDSSRIEVLRPAATSHPDSGSDWSPRPASDSSVSAFCDPAVFRLNIPTPAVLAGRDGQVGIALVDSRSGGCWIGYEPPESVLEGMTALPIVDGRTLADSNTLRPDRLVSVVYAPSGLHPSTLLSPHFNPGSSLSLLIHPLIVPGSSGLFCTAPSSPLVSGTTTPATPVSPPRLATSGGVRPPATAGTDRIRPTTNGALTSLSFWSRFRRSFRSRLSRSDKLPHSMPSWTDGPAETISLVGTLKPATWVIPVDVSGMTDDLDGDLTPSYRARTSGAGVGTRRTANIWSTVLVRLRGPESIGLSDRNGVDQEGLLIQSDRMVSLAQVKDLVEAHGHESTLASPKANVDADQDRTVEQVHQNYPYKHHPSHNQTSSPVQDNASPGHLAVTTKAGFSTAPCRLTLGLGSGLDLGLSSSFDLTSAADKSTTSGQTAPKPTERTVHEPSPPTGPLSKPEFSQSSLVPSLSDSEKSSIRSTGSIDEEATDTPATGVSVYICPPTPSKSDRLPDSNIKVENHTQLVSNSKVEERDCPAVAVAVARQREAEISDLGGVSSENGVESVNVRAGRDGVIAIVRVVRVLAGATDVRIEA